MRSLLTCMGPVVLMASLASCQELQLVPQELRIPRGQTARLEFGTLPQKDHTITLDIMARLDADGLGGSSYFMRLVLNGRPVESAKSRRAVRLLNRPYVSPVAPDLPYPWSGGNVWRVLYAPDFQAALAQGFYVGNPYQTVLDVTDLTNPAAENRLEITNECPYAPPAGSKANYDLVIQSLIVRIQPGASPTMAAVRDETDAINRGTPGAGAAAYRGELLPGGGFRLRVGTDTLEFSSRISYPNAGLNRLVAAAQAAPHGQPGWKPEVKPGPKGGQVVAQGADYRLRRTVRFLPRRVAVSDELTNLHPEQKLGLLVAHELSLTDPKATVRLAGNPDPSVSEYYAPGNPSVFVNYGSHGVGLLCEDDVLRNQALLYCDPEAEVAGLRTEMLCLPPRSTYTLEWSVYPVASGDYFDFVNLVREDWGANYTVEGAWTFFSPDAVIATAPETLRQQFTRLGITRACYCGGWVDPQADRKRIGFGMGIWDDYWASFRARLRQAAERIHEAVPGCKVYIYYDSQRDTSEGGPERYRDSWLTGPDGKQLYTEWGGVYSLTHSVVATLDNTYGRAMLGAVDRYLSELGCDGLYWDEMECVAYGAPLLTYNVGDGYSCLLDLKTYTIKQEVAVNTLQGEGHRLAVIDRVRQLGGDLMGNGPIATKDILSRKPQRMIEIQHNEFWNYEGDLQSPLGYAGSRRDFGNWLRGLKLAKLLVGTSYTYEYDIPAYSFPFTPLEVHAGYLLGRERITACHAGNYGWPGERCLVQVHHFGSDGKLTDRDFPTIVTTQEARTKVALKDDEEAIVLVRLPVTLTPSREEATVSAVRYGADGLRLRLDAPAGAKLALKTGEMPIRPGQPFTLTVNGDRWVVRADPEGTVTTQVQGRGVDLAVTPG